MGYHYIALLGTGPAQATPLLSDARAALLGARGMRAVPMAGPAVIFVAAETPAQAVPGGVVIGHIFTHDGKPAKLTDLPAQTSARQLAEHLLTHCWGEYLLIQAACGAVPELEILREPSGGVPCIYSFEQGAGFVTSDTSLAVELGLHDRRIDWGFIAQALAYPHVNTRRTGLAGVSELLPGCSLVLRGPTASVREDWLPWTFVSRGHRQVDPDEAAADVRKAVITVSEAWARTDKEILVELSGGLDSSIVAVSLQGIEAQVACSTLVTPVPGADERRYAGQVADALGVALHVEHLGFENARFDFPLPVQTPKPRMSALQYVAHEAMTSAARRHGAAGFFSGGGGDTVFCYAAGAAPAADAFRERGLAGGLAAIRDLSTLHGCTCWKAGRLAIGKLRRGARIPFRANTSLLAPSLVIPELDRHPWFDAPDGLLPGDQERIAELAGTQVFRDSAPRGSTHWLRFPLLSQPVVEACLKAPSWMWINGGRNRALARQAFADRLPYEVLQRRSKGTFMSYLGAIYQRRKSLMREFLLDGHLHARGLLDTEALERFFHATLPPRDTSFMRILDLCMIENWVRRQP
jgi:asparagine synthase (glutamine-hydrolysing)